MKKLKGILAYALFVAIVLAPAVLLGCVIVHDAIALKESGVPAETIMLYFALGCCIGLGLFFVKEIILRIIYHKKGE